MAGAALDNEFPAPSPDTHSGHPPPHTIALELTSECHCFTLPVSCSVPQLWV